MADFDIAPGLLVAMPQLEDPNFARSVVLMIRHSEEGSFGIIANRPSEISLQQVLESLDLNWNGSPDAVVWSGGPVEPDTGFLLHAQIDLLHHAFLSYISDSRDMMQMICEALEQANPATRAPVNKADTSE